MTDGSPASPRRRQLLAAGRNVAVGLGLGGLATLPAGCEEEDRPRVPPPDGPPNVILFLLDDFGVRDCGHCGSDWYRTPNFDRLARQGIRFAQAYSPSPLCSASRAAIITGKYPHRLGITGAIRCPPGCVPITRARLPARAEPWWKVITPDFVTQLSTEETTLAERLRDAGYRTAHIGKWHLGGAGESPAEQGYEVVVGGGPEAVPANYFAPWGLANYPERPPGEFVTRYLTSESLAFIGNRDARPFFLALNHYGVHWPLQAESDAIDRYTATRRPDAAQRNAIYAAMIESVDNSLGEILDRLRLLGHDNNTLLIVSSDNGGLMQTWRDPLLRRVTSNGPFRGGKANLYEGGIRVPLLMRWPAGIAAGITCQVPACGTDLLPTVLEAAGLPPAEAIDGRSLAAAWRDPAALPVRDLHWHFPHYVPQRESTPDRVDEHAYHALPASVLRAGNYKLVRIYGEGDGGAAIHELYNLDADAGEQYDLAAMHPDIVAAMAQRLDAHLAESGAVIPAPNPQYHEAHEGWRGNDWVRTAMSHGVLRAEGSGEWPALSHRVLLTGSTDVRVRLRSERNVRLQLFYSHAATGGFNTTQRSVVDLPAGSGFTECVFPVIATADAPIRALQLRVGTQGDVVEIDDIRLTAAGDASQVLEQSHFSGISGLSYGGSWYSASDTFLARGTGTLQIDLAGPDPVILSPPVRLHGPMRMRWRMRSTGHGNGVLSWSLSYDGAASSPRRVPFTLVHDGQWQDYDVHLPETADVPVQRIAIALGDGLGTAEIDVIRIEDSSASLLAIWNF